MRRLKFPSTTSRGRIKRVSQIAFSTIDAAASGPKTFKNQQPGELSHMYHQSIVRENYSKVKTGDGAFTVRE